MSISPAPAHFLSNFHLCRLPTFFTRASIAVRCTHIFPSTTVVVAAAEWRRQGFGPSGSRSGKKLRSSACLPRVSISRPGVLGAAGPSFKGKEGKAVEERCGVRFSVENDGGRVAREPREVLGSGRLVLWIPPRGAMTKSKSTAKKALDSYTIKGTNKAVKVGDCVVLRAQDPEKPPYVARVEKIESDHRNHVKVRVRWYYRPEESIGGRRQFHGAKELFLSDHYDVQSADTIEGKCTVHTFKNYTKLDSVESDDYFCRFEYKAATGGFTPDRVAVYCKCEMPYNPDVLMVQCESCKDWFHPTCMNISTEQVKKMEHFFCSDCVEDGDKKLHNATKDSSLELNMPPEPKRRRLNRNK